MMRVGFVTTSWPSEERPWAGHFIAGLAESLVLAGVDVCVVAPCFRDDGALEKRRNVRVVEAHVSGQRGQLPKRWWNWPRVVAALARKTRAVQVDLWMAHWWPTLAALPRAAPAVAVLHGSDVDLLERLPRAVARFVDRRGPVVAVASGLAMRFSARLDDKGALPIVCPLGASGPGRSDRLPDFAEDWVSERRPKVLTVGRAAKGKGLEVAQRISDMNDAVSYLVVGDPPVLPGQVRSLLKHADLCVIPSRAGRNVPSEGRPHIIAQAMVAGVPCVGGPNTAVREAMREFGQVECLGHDIHALSRSIEQALETQRYAQIKSSAAIAGAELTWSAVTNSWMNVLARGPTSGVRF